jgi:hypothetical protein
MLFKHGVKRLKKLSTHSRKKLSKFPIMRRPNFNRVFILHIDWSALGISVILGQLDEESKEYDIAYASQGNNKAKNNYSSYKEECLAIVWVVIHFKPIFMAPNSLCISTTSLSNG